MMTAKQIHERIKNWLAWWQMDDSENDAENIAYIESRINAGLLELFDAMRNDIGVMSEYGDDETGLLYELLTADNDIINEYKETFINDARAAI